jgi:RNase H-like domain found in reverse transcriptase/Reverse transcriptase (RNA-dependent DNA polymerase)
MYCQLREQIHTRCRPSSCTLRSGSDNVLEGMDATVLTTVRTFTKHSRQWYGVCMPITHGRDGLPILDTMVCWSEIRKKDQAVRFINDLQQLNKRIRRVPFPLPKIQDFLLKMEGLNMGYYHTASRQLCMVIFPWGKYEMQCLQMGLCNSPDIFQEKMSELMYGLENVCAYINDLLVISTGTYSEHLTDVKKVLARLQDAGLKVNAGKSSFAQGELEYLGYWITREGIQPQPKKVQAILNIKPPTNKTQLRSFIGMVNYYRDAWIRRSNILAPLALLSGKNAVWKWTDVHQQAFDTIKRVIAREVLLAYPDFSKKFKIFTDASDKQLGAVITQEGRPIAYYSRKLNSSQLNYTTTEKELLAIVETLKEFRSNCSDSIH